MWTLLLLCMCAAAHAQMPQVYNASDVVFFSVNLPIKGPAVNAVLPPLSLEDALAAAALEPSERTKIINIYPTLVSSSVPSGWDFPINITDPYDVPWDASWPSRHGQLGVCGLDTWLTPEIVMYVQDAVDTAQVRSNNTIIQGACGVLKEFRPDPGWAPYPYAMPPWLQVKYTTVSDAPTIARRLCTLMHVFAGETQNVTIRNLWLDNTACTEALGYLNAAAQTSRQIPVLRYTAHEPQVIQDQFLSRVSFAMLTSEITPVSIERTSDDPLCSDAFACNYSPVDIELRPATLASFNTTACSVGYPRYFYAKDNGLLWYYPPSAGVVVSTTIIRDGALQGERMTCNAYGPCMYKDIIGQWVWSVPVDNIYLSAYPYPANYGTTNATACGAYIQSVVQAAGFGGAHVTAGHPPTGLSYDLQLSIGTIVLIVSFMAATFIVAAIGSCFFVLHSRWAEICCVQRILATMKKWTDVLVPLSSEQRALVEHCYSINDKIAAAMDAPASQEFAARADRLVGGIFRETPYLIDLVADMVQTASERVPAMQSQLRAAYNTFLGHQLRKPKTE